MSISQWELKRACGGCGEIRNYHVIAKPRNSRRESSWLWQSKVATESTAITRVRRHNSVAHEGVLGFCRALVAVENSMVILDCH